MATSSVMAAGKIDLKSVTDGTFAAKRISGIDPLKGTDQYAQISQDGKQIVQYSFRTGKQTAVLFDVSNTVGEKIDAFDGYILSPDGKRMLIRTQTEPVYRRSYKAVFYIYNMQSHLLQRLSDGGPQQVPVWSPDGNQVAFVRDNNIFLVKLLYDNSESQVTTDGKFNHVINGIPDWVNEEEFSYNSALEFNADGTMLFWTKFDESNVKTYSLQMFRGMKPSKDEYEVYPGDYSYKYPKAGEDNAKVSVWSFDIKTKKTQKMQVPLDEDGYIPRIKRTSDPEKMVVYTMNRHQDVLTLYTVNPRSTVSQMLLQDKVSKYIKEEVVAAVTIGADHILMPSDRDGFMRIYLYDINGRQQRVVGGDYDITAIYGYDSKTGDIYYQAAALNPHDRQIYVSHKNGKTQRLTDKEGCNYAVFSGDFKYFVNTWSDYDTPYIYSTRDNQGKVIATNLDNAELKKKIADYGWTKKETFSFTTSEGVTLDGWMVKPANFDPSRKYPVIMFQYSGPGNQQVMNSWNAGSMGQGGAYDMYLAQQGYIVVCVDGRGTGGRGADFEKCTYLHLGNLEARDQVETALYLGTLSYVDKDNIGIWGWSYGGYCTIMSMSEGRQVFKAGVAVAPPTSYRFYDTI